MAERGGRERSSEPAPGGGAISRAMFERELDEAYPTLRTIAAAVVGAGDADDVVQDAAIVAMGKLERFEPGTSFRSWMAAFVRNVAANHRRREHRHRKRARRYRRDAETIAESGSAVRPIDPRLQSALAELEEEQRTCLLLRVVMGHSYAEIAETLSMPEPTTRSHVYRARQRLLTLLRQPAGEAP